MPGKIITIFLKQYKTHSHTACRPLNIKVCGKHRDHCTQMGKSGS